MRSSLGQLIRYGVVGLLSNAIGFLLYLALTAAGLGPALAMTLVYAIGVMQTFVVNKRWSFAHDGRSGPVFRKYVLLYAFGYVLNVLLLFFCVDILGWRHQIVMLGLIFVMVALFFAGQKYWVFKEVSASE